MRSAGSSHANLGPAEPAGMTDVGMRMSSLLPALTMSSRSRKRYEPTRSGFNERLQASNEVPVEQHVHLLGCRRRDGVDSQHDVIGAFLGQRQADDRALAARDAHGDALEVRSRPPAPVEHAVPFTGFNAGGFTVRDCLPRHVPRQPEIHRDAERGERRDRGDAPGDRDHRRPPQDRRVASRPRARRGRPHDRHARRQQRRTDRRAW